MPRGPRLDAPGVLHHVMVRGIESRRIFRQSEDYEAFIARVAALGVTGAWLIYAWALLPNHAHLLVRTSSRPLSRSMRSLLTGYAGAFNRRYNRRGHLFQNRYKSIVVEEEPYFLELVRYLHLNPLRAEVVSSLAALDRYPYTGHAALMGTVPRSWQDVGSVLSQFSARTAEARHRYRSFMAAGVAQGRRPEFQGGGLIRSLGGWKAVKALRRGREAYTTDERVLGSGGFVEALLQEAEYKAASQARLQRRRFTVDRLVRKIGTAVRASPAGILGPSQTRSASRARQLLAYVWVELLGRRASELAVALGRTRSNITWAAKQGAGIAPIYSEEVNHWLL
jgi:putative transposase